MNTPKLNFSHDLALAANCNHYTPPPNVQVMERDLCRLVDYIPPAEVSYHPYAPVWGWDRSFVNELYREGYSDLPTNEQLEIIRMLSSRKNASYLLKKLVTECEGLPLVGESEYVVTEQRLNEILYNVPLILKEPLSGSGRGLRFFFDNATDAQMNWACKCIRQQGGVVVEPYYHKIEDFAFEFIMHENDIEYLGLSVFETNSNNVYSGNVISPQERLWERMYKYFDKSTFNRMLLFVQQNIKEFFLGKYLGPVGVDMMIIEIDGELYIHPCVEINVRRTMGELSLHLQPLVSCTVDAFFCLVFRKNAESLKEYVSSLSKAEYDKDNRLFRGVKLLTPVYDNTQYVALLSVK